MQKMTTTDIANEAKGNALIRQLASLDLAISRMLDDTANASESWFQDNLDAFCEGAAALEDQLRALGFQKCMGGTWVFAPRVAVAGYHHYC